MLGYGYVPSAIGEDNDVTSQSFSLACAPELTILECGGSEWLDSDSGMVRFRGGSIGNRSSGGRRSVGTRNSGRSSVASKIPVNKSRGARSSSQKGVVAYSIYNSKGKRTYVGTTANPKRRAARHSQSGKLTRGGKLLVELNRMPRS